MEFSEGGRVRRAGGPGLDDHESIMPTPADRRRSRIRLSVAEVNAGQTEQVVHVPFVPAALIAGATGAAAGWVVCVGLTLVGWFTAMAIPVPTMLGFATQLWLGGHAAGAGVGGFLVTLTPLGLSLLFVLLARSAMGLAVRHLSTEDLQGRGSLVAWGLMTGSYAFVVATGALLAGSSPRVGWALLGGLVAGGLAAGWALWPHLRAQIPTLAWAAGLGRAITVGLATMVAAAAAVFCLALVLGAERIGRIDAALAPDPVGSVLLVALQLLFLPNLLIWTMSWLAGAGFTVGAGTLVSPMLTASGLLPAIPVLGAVPEAGPGSPGAIAWLLAPTLAGGLAGWFAARATPAGRALTTWLARGSVAGLGTAAAVLLLAALSGGDLAPQRLTGLGPVLVTLLMMVPLPLVVGGAVGAAVHWFVNGRHRPDGNEATVELDQTTEPLETLTVPLGRRG